MLGQMLDVVCSSLVCLLASGGKAMSMSDLTMDGLTRLLPSSYSPRLLVGSFLMFQSSYPSLPDRMYLRAQASF